MPRVTPANELWQMNMPLWRYFCTGILYRNNNAIGIKGFFVTQHTEILYKNNNHFCEIMSVLELDVLPNREY